jgi:arylsulfatase A
MTRRRVPVHHTILLALFAVLLPPMTIAQAAKPNFVLIFIDDQGYGDLSCFGSKTIQSPNIDRLADEGRKFTSFMVASPVCTPSRAALLTGCYPKRVGMHQHVLFPSSTKGLNPEEHTIADHLKSQGYATACFGKWHLGHHPEVLPTSNGFDTYYGIPYSNDMNHPDNQGKPKGGFEGMDILWKDPESTLTKWKTPLMEDERIVELPVDQRTVTRRYTQKAIDFVKAHQEEPFFVYLPHSMPHIPLYVPDDVRDPNPLNAYTNTIEHIDAEVGRLLDVLDELKLTENTYVIYTTDNGPWLQFKHHGGSAGPLREGKGTTFEGGQRVPCLIRGPGIPAGTVTNQLTGTIDVLPTIAAITGQPLPGKKIDGKDVSKLWTGEVAESPRTEFVHYTSRGDLEGIRSGDWKLLVKKRRGQNAANKPPQVMLFHLGKDVGEQNNVANANPDIVTRLQARMKELDAEITKNARAAWMKQ